MLRSARKCLLSTDGFSCALLASFAENGATLAHRIVDVASAQLWLIEGVPFADAITMLEIRRRFEFPQKDCRIYAIQTGLVAQRENCRSKHQLIANQEETQNAVA
jgi:hypothetical protein